MCITLLCLGRLLSLRDVAWKHGLNPLKKCLFNFFGKCFGYSNWFICKSWLSLWMHLFCKQLKIKGLNFHFPPTPCGNTFISVYTHCWYSLVQPSDTIDPEPCTPKGQDPISCFYSVRRLGAQARPLAMMQKYTPLTLVCRRNLQ